MSYVQQSNQHHYRRAGVPFAEYTEYLRTMGEAVYDAFDMMIHAAVSAGRAVTAMRRAHENAKELQGLSDHALKDIGIHRSEIRYLAKRSAEYPEVDYRVFRQ